MKNMLVTRKVFSRPSAGCRAEEEIRSAAFAANGRAKAFFMSALLATVLAAFALPSFASSMVVQPADSSFAPPKAFEERQDRLDYERAHWTPADRKLAERASRELHSGKDDVALSKLEMKIETTRDCDRSVLEEQLRQAEAWKAGMTPEQRAARKKSEEEYFNGEAAPIKDLKMKGAK